MLHSINREQRLYVIRAGHGGFSCLGYDVAEKRRSALWAWVGQECPAIRKGSKRHYADYLAALGAAKDKAKRNNIRCPVELEPRLVGLEGKRVEVTSPDGHRERFIVGKSTGWMPIHLEIKRRDSIGGCQAYVPEGATVRLV